MSIGLKTFLSLLVFALFLYLITRDSWNWRRIGRRRLSVSALIIGCLIVVGMYAWNRFAPG
jgi:hypothetical protein